MDRRKYSLKRYCPECGSEMTNKSVSKKWFCASEECELIACTFEHGYRGEKHTKAIYISLA